MHLVILLVMFPGFHFYFYSQIMHKYCISERWDSHLFLFPPAFIHPLPQELSPFHQLLVFVPVHLPPPDLQNILALKRRH